MTKKAISIIFILIAGLAFLTDAVIPHHHHDNQICFNISHCKSENDGNQHNTNGHSHDHDCSNGNPGCVLNQFTAFSTTNVKHEIIKVYRPVTRLISSEILLSAVLKNLADHHYTKSGNADIPYLLIRIYSEYAVASTGLRAPPSV